MKLNYKKTILVGFAFFLICAFWQAYDTIIPKMLTDKFGMSQTLSGVIMALDNVLALFMLPLFGTLSDKCKSKRGRRTPFIIFGTVMAAVFFVALSVGDHMQLKQLEAVTPSNPTAQQTLYAADLEIPDPNATETEAEDKPFFEMVLSFFTGEKERKMVAIQDVYSEQEFSDIQMYSEDGTANKIYVDYVVPARQAYAAQMTAQNKVPLIIFVVVLLVVLLSMATFRSPAVALMPDVTVKPLRSKANAIINLMGAVGGIIVLGLGMLFGTGKSENAMMSYTMYFAVISALMIASLVIFLCTVKEPQMVERMHADSERYGIDNSEDDFSGTKKLSKGELVSLLLLLASLVLWFMGYNAVTSKYSVYASTVLGLDYNMTLMIATGAAIIAYIPVGFLASKIGRKKTILIGILILGGSFVAAAFMRAGSPAIVMSILFALAGIGWATINVNSFPMVVELSKGGDVGKYTGFYYTASMAAQLVTPIFSGFLMDKLGMTVLFPYGALFVLLAFVTMLFVRHGDNRPQPVKGIDALADIEN